MKKLSLILLAALMCMSAMQADQTLTRKGDTTVVNTQVIGKKIRGFKGNTPVKIYIKANRVVKVEAQPNQETPQYFAEAVKLLKQYEGLTVNKAAKTKIDGVTGATYSSEALKKNVQAGLEYYKKNK